jgi:hypothetical protein
MMYSITVAKRIEIPVNYLQVTAEPRYWEDAFVDGIEDTDGALIPCRYKDLWTPIIELETGRIINWREGVTAKIHYKVCDAGEYTLLAGKWDEDNLTEVKTIEGYVPKIMSPGGKGYGDYIIMEIDENGFIENWKVNLREWEADED